MQQVTGRRTELAPLSPELGPAVLAWAAELRALFATVNMSVSLFARLHPIDKGTVSRYLNGKRVPTDRWFLDQLLALRAKAGAAVTQEVCAHLVDLQMAALKAAHPHEYRVRKVSDELEVAVTSWREAERYARVLHEQLAERSRAMEDLRAEADHLRTAWNDDRARHNDEIADLTQRLQLAWERARRAEYRVRILENLLDQLEASSATGGETGPDRPNGAAAAQAREEEKDLFLATTSHELRTPITVIQEYAATLETRWDQLTDDNRQEAVSAIAARAQSLARLVEHLLLGSRAGTGDLALTFEPFDLAHLVESAVTALQSLSDIHQVQLEIAEELPPARGDNLATDIILGQLLENAFTNAPDGGVVDVQVKAEHGELVVTVSDEGSGIRGVGKTRAARYRGSSQARSAGGSGCAGQ